MQRRTYLAGAAGTLGALAGCLGGGDGGDGSMDGDGSMGDGTTTDGDAPTLASHPSGQGVDDEPVLGPSVDAATAVVVAFEDPACTICRRFEERTFPTLKTDYVDPGDLAFVYRVMPITYEWGKPAVQALEATYDRSPEAFWALKAHYYAEQDAFGTDTVLDLTAAFLAGNTDLDAEAVVADARERRFDDRVQEDLGAGDAAGVTATPTFYLFRDGEFRTTISGAKDASVFAAALGF